MWYEVEVLLPRSLLRTDLVLGRPFIWDNEGVIDVRRSEIILRILGASTHTVSCALVEHATTRQEAEMKKAGTTAVAEPVARKRSHASSLISTEYEAIATTSDYDDPNTCVGFDSTTRATKHASARRANETTPMRTRSF